MLFNLSVILSCQLVGEVLVAATGLPLPGPVCGMVLLFCGLMVWGLGAEMAALADGLLAHLALLFVPAGVGVMLHGGLIGRDWLPIAAALVGSTLVTVAVTALIMVRLSRRQGEGQEPGAE